MQDINTTPKELKTEHGRAKKKRKEKEKKIGKEGDKKTICEQGKEKDYNSHQSCRHDELKGSIRHELKSPKNDNFFSNIRINRISCGKISKRYLSLLRE